MTSTKANDWSTMPSVSPGIGSPKTMMPPAIVETLAAALVIVITGTASPVCRPRAEAKKAMTEAAMQVNSQGDERPARPPEPTTPVRALIATSETPKRRPDARPSRTPWW